MRTRLRALLCACLLVSAMSREATAECVQPEPHADWANRSSDSDWAEGIYPARNDLPSGVVALTFDDGPHRTRTAEALGQLEAREWKATFFLTGAAIRSSTYHLVKQIVDEGHVLGNHGWRHDTRMALHFDDPTKAEAYMAAEFELTQIRVDLAMVATSKEDFASMAKAVFGSLSRRSSPDDEIQAMPGLRARHAKLLAARGYAEGARPYPIRWARPPGGNPYLGHHSAKRRDAFARALAGQGLALVMWNGGSGDSNPAIPGDERRDPERLQKTVRSIDRAGGVYVMHDRISPASLRTVLDAFEARETEVVGLTRMMELQGC